MRIALLLLLATFSIHAQTPNATQAADDARAAKVDALFAEWNRADTPGYSVAVIRDGKTVLARGYGSADLERDVRITPRSVFDIGSTSKQFTAASILLLEQEGKLSIDHEVRKYIPELRDYGKPLTIRHLLNHTSGIRDYLTLAALGGLSFSNDYSDEETLSWITAQKALNFLPGEEHLYSNSGYYLLGQIVERASGMSLRQYAAKKIFEPLGMTNTHFHDDPDEIVKHRAIAYSPAKNGFRIDMSRYHVVGDGAVYTTTEDLAKWDTNFYQPKVGGAALLDALQQRGKLNNGEQLDYAAGLSHGTHRGFRLVGHGGGWAGYRTDMIRFPEQRLTVIAISNLGSADPSSMARSVAEIYLDAPLPSNSGAKSEAKAEAPKPSEAKAVTLSAAELEKLAGQYVDRKQGSYATVQLRDGKLYYLRGTRPYELRPLGNGRFEMVGPPVSMTFQGDTLEVQMRGKPFASMQRTTDAPVLSATDLAAYAGEYRSEEVPAPHRLRVHEGKLVARAGYDTKDVVLWPRERDVFEGDGLTLRFVRDDKGAIVAYSVNAGRVQNIRFERVQR
ncbi:MAG TPA: serine hydrolase domain-containing protein [Thermoanaerobaculia bacterium]|jgi:CubicO group peptidase (beta-lactamase class C family)